VTGLPNASSPSERTTGCGVMDSRCESVVWCGMARGISRSIWCECMTSPPYA
jgi:hypothetical protein